MSRTRIVTLLAVLLLAALNGEGKVYRYQYQKIAEVSGPLQLTVRNAAGNITITTNDEAKLKIDAVKSINAESQGEAEQIAENIQIDVSATGGHYLVEPRFAEVTDRSPSFFKRLLGKSGEVSYGTVDFTISVPTDCSAELFNTSGNIELAGTRGKVAIAGTAGDVSLRDMAGNVEIKTTSGNVTLKDIEGSIRVNASGSDITFGSLSGDLEVRNSSGKTEGESLIGDLTVTQTTGVVNVNRVEGDVRIKSISGRVMVGQEFGALDISSESGDISVKTSLNSEKDYFIQTVSGAIELLIPGSAGGKVSIEAESGDIDTQIPIAIDSFSKTRITGSFGSGGPKILLATKSGEITLAGF